ncbi:MAG: hypothetical protein E4H00_03015 [Myxococcales bacterium]|nr:MAG: hypothetical protein E4H00_03015 [Myxococcales bacterium]
MSHLYRQGLKPDEWVNEKLRRLDGIQQAMERILTQLRIRLSIRYGKPRAEITTCPLDASHTYSSEDAPRYADPERRDERALL